MNIEKTLINRFMLFIMGIILTACTFLFITSPLSPFLPVKPHCLPILYPSAKLAEAYNGNLTLYTIDKPLNDIIQFYEQILIETGYKIRLWQIFKMGKTAALFECSSTVNTYEGERGCIYLKDIEGKTAIYTVWSYFPENAPACDYYIDDHKGR